MATSACYCLILMSAGVVVATERRCHIPLVCDGKPGWIEVPRENTEIVLTRKYEAEMRHFEENLNDVRERTKGLQKQWEDYKKKLETTSICSPPAEDSTNNICATTKQLTTSPPISTSGCSGSSFTFTNGDQTTDYVRYRGTLPNMTEFSICAWLSPAPLNASVKGSVFSYCLQGGFWCNSLLVFFSSPTRLSLQTHSYNENNALWTIKPIMSRSHFCITASSDKRNVGLYINGEPAGKPSDWINWKVDVPSGGMVIVGHEQDNHVKGSVLTPHFAQSNESFVGKIENLNLWNRILNYTEIRNMNQTNCSCPDDAIVTLNETVVEVKGDVNASYYSTCN